MNVETLMLIGSLFLKSTALLAAAFAFHLLLGRRRTLLQSGVWNACIAGLLLLPFAALGLPRVEYICLPPTPPTSDEVHDTEEASPLPREASAQRLLEAAQDESRLIRLWRWMAGRLK